MLSLQYAILYGTECFFLQSGTDWSVYVAYYKADLDAGRITPLYGPELLDCMWIEIAELSLFQDEVTAQFAAGYCITVQVCVGGIDHGNDATNDLSYMASRPPRMSVSR